MALMQDAPAQAGCINRAVTRANEPTPSSRTADESYLVLEEVNLKETDRTRAVNVSEKSYVLKEAWRAEGRHTESSIHQETTTGMRWVAGSDVTAVCQSTTPNGRELFKLSDSGNQLRSLWIPSVLHGFNVPWADPTLHRLVLSPRGKPLWKFDSERALLQGLLTAVEGLVWLSNQGISHRDIHPRNILLSVDDTAPHGFIIDLEFAKVTGHGAPGTTSPIGERKTGPPMTGVMQFRALAVLVAQSAGRRIEQTSDHDAESFALVIEYAVLKYLRDKAIYTALRKSQETPVPKPKKGRKKEINHPLEYFQGKYDSAFGAHDLRKILEVRETGVAFTWYEIGLNREPLEGWMDKNGLTPPLAGVLDSLKGMHRLQQDRAATLSSQTFMPTNLRDVYDARMTIGRNVEIPRIFTVENIAEILKDALDQYDSTLPNK